MTETLFYNAKIYTPEGYKSWMVVSDNKISQIGDQTTEFDGERIDLQGQLVLPGLHDSHIHTYSLGRSYSRLKLHGTSSVSELQEKLKSFAKEENKDWIIGHGWDQDEMNDNRYPSKEDLDEIEADKPVLLYRACNHIGVVNSKALKIMGITAKTEDPEGGKIDRDHKGNPTGILREEGLSLVSSHISHLDEAYRIEYYKRGLQVCLEKGLTAIHTNDAQAWKYYKKLAEADELPIRVFLTLKYSDLDNLEYVPEYNETKGMLTAKRIKLFADGSLGAETAALRDNYEGLDHNGILIDKPDVLTEKIKRAHSLGFQLEIHAIGDYAAEVVIDGFRSVGLSKEDRPLITHCQVLAKDLIEIMAQNGYIANIQPPFVPTDARWAEKRLGINERLKYSYAWKTLLDNGVIVSGGSDAPIESPDPFWGIYCAMIRPDPEGNTWRAEECLDFEESLEIYTINGAYAVGSEDKLGRIEVGYFADFVICNPEITEDAEKLLDDPVSEVWVDGKLRYKRS